MCNAEPEDDGNKEPEKFNKSKSLVGQKCVKCEEPGILITRIHDSFCKACFQVYVVHKFRAAIGKSKLIRDGEQVMVAFSGGANSAALLHLIQDGLSKRAHKKLRFLPTILHIDECGLLDMSGELRQQKRGKIIQLMQRSGFPSFLANLEQALEIEKKGDTGSGLATNSVVDNDSLVWKVDERSPDWTAPLPAPLLHGRLKALLSDLTTVTCQEDFVRNLRKQLIVTLARQLGFTKVLTAECSTRLSVQTLTDVAQGRGSQVSLNTGFSDARNGDVMFIRPVRDLNAKELTMYNNLFEVDSVFIPNLTTKSQPFASIEKLTETFVTGLQADFHSTVSNIIRTSEKLGRPDLEQSIKCSFCQSPLDTNVGKASALKAIEFSQKLSRSKRAHMISSSATNVCPSDELVSVKEGEPPGRCGQADGSCLETATSRPQIKLIQTLCYGCRLTLSDLQDNGTNLPAFIQQEALKMCQQERIREQIADFILDDDDS